MAIRHVAIGRGNLPYTIIWHFYNSGKYSVRSGYRVLCNMVDLDDRDDSMEHKQTLWELWNSDVPRVFHYIIPVLSNLQRRGMEVNPRCPRCEKEDETVDHALIECEKTEQVRKMVHECYVKSKQEEVAADQMRFGDLNWADIVLVMSWAIWGARNKKVHDSIEFSASETTAFVISYIMEFQRCKKRMQPKQTQVAAQWSAPDPNVIKINFDGVYDNVAKTGSFGVIARDYRGLVIGAYAGRLDFVPDAYTAECKAALKAIIWARDMGFSRIMLEGDALTVIKKVNSGEYDFSPLGVYIAELKEARNWF
ncbi:hypothetical protein COLO4_08437 [Corchorus olitorius]|uniref:RNase H type-1 domain-containing protein n=1 Tax=Corchorus olitorius TaxID=93759 RepID=A0A1R3KFU0_9ROSI|nr:hypothetical protein COLO4_08437 [Corchorus olitorius]